MHPLKLVEIKNPFGILQPTTQIPREWVGFFLFQKNMFWWDTLMYTHGQGHGQMDNVVYSGMPGTDKKTTLTLSNGLS